LTNYSELSAHDCITRVVKEECQYTLADNGHVNKPSLCATLT